MTIDLDYRKWPDRQHWRMMNELLGRDEHGTWVGKHPPVEITHGPHGAMTFEFTFVTLIPEDDWWVATFYDPPANDTKVYIDITTPAVWLTDTHVQAVDLDLDVVQLTDGRVILADEDEFAEHQIEFTYPADIIANATDAAARMTQMLRTREGPFGDAGWDWLTRIQ